MIVFTNETDRTPENVALAEQYDFYTGAIDDGAQYRAANERNDRILDTLRANGVEEVIFQYTPMFCSTETVRTINLTER